MTITVNTSIDIDLCIVAYVKDGKVYIELHEMEWEAQETCENLEDMGATETQFIEVHALREPFQIMVDNKIALKR